jgi:uncharacterized membrane protein SirB2
MLTLHITLIITSFFGFIVRVILSVLTPLVLKNKFFKITPHIIDTLLLLSGVTLVFQENWLESDYSWIITKLIILFVYIILGIIVMRGKGFKRWLAFISAIGCYGCIIVVALTKQGFLELL